MLLYILLMYFLYNKYKEYKQVEDKEKIYKQLTNIENELQKYENLYPLTQTTVMETDVNKDNKIVEEDTPDGNVWMMYDDFTKSFLYWSKKAVTYKYLETVARKYVILYECKELYINKNRLEVEEEKKENNLFIKQKIIKPVLTNANIYKWVGKKYEKEEKKEVEIKKISYAEFIKNKK